MHLKDIAQNFNISYFFVFCCLLVFSVLLSLQAGGVISWSFGVIFLPLWIWKALTFTGTAVGIVTWVRKKRQRKDVASRRNFMAMIQSTLLQLVIFVEEILIAVNLDLSDRHSWAAIFTPFYMLFAFSIVGCIFSCCMKKINVELEILGFVNILQLIFLGIRLDGVVTWRWAVVLIPTWVLLLVTFVCLVLYTCLQCCLISADENRQQAELRKPLIATTVLSFTLSTICFTIFLALLVSRLDNKLAAHYSAIFVPLHISILCLFPTTLTRRPGNPMWFGLQKNFLEVALELCPWFKEYLNVSWTKDSGEEVRQLSEITAKLKRTRNCKTPAKANFVVLESKDYPYINIMSPD